MALRRLCDECAKCPKVDTCAHKRMEMVCFLEPTANESQEILSENVTVPHKYRKVEIAPNTEITIDIEDIKKEIEQAIAKQAKLYGDFFKAVLNGG